MYLKNDAARYREPYARHVAELRAAMPAVRELIDAANQHVAEGALYKALKEIRKLTKREEELARLEPPAHAPDRVFVSVFPRTAKLTRMRSLTG